MSFKSITSASALSTSEINQLLDIASEMKRIVNSRVKRGPQLLGKSLAVLDFKGDPLTANTLKLACEYMSGLSFVFSDCESVERSVARAQALGANFVAIIDSDGRSAERAQASGAQIVDCFYDASAVKILTYLFTLKEELETLKSLDVTVWGRRAKKMLHLLRNMESAALQQRWQYVFFRWTKKKRIRYCRK